MAEIGLGFWTEEEKGGRGARIMPPIPDTGWSLPTEFPDLSGQGDICIDVETKDPDLRTKGPGTHRGAFICGVGIGTEAGHREYYPVAHEGFPNLDKKQVFGWLKKQLSTDQAKIGARLIYDREMLENEGIKPKGPFYDIQVAEPLLDETQLSYSLENIAQRRLGEGKRDEEMERWLTAAYGKGNIKENIYRAPPVVVAPYGISDIDLPLRIMSEQREELEQQNLTNLFELESKLTTLLLKMRQRGVRVDIPAAEALGRALDTRYKDAMAKLKHLTGHEPDIWSADSLAKMFDDMSVNYDYTAKGKPSFQKEWLAKHPWEGAKLVVEARTTSKFKGTFVDGYILEGNVNGRIYTQFHQLRGEQGGTVSGRFSSSLPNLQNLPIRDPILGPLVRACFLPEDGCRWWKLDWSQIEFRLAVHFAYLLGLKGSQQVVDQYLTDATTDYHAVTAMLTGLPRNLAKNVNFGIVYGLGLEAFCNGLGISLEEGEDILFQYHSKLPFVKPLYNTAMYRAKDRGEIITIGGRKRRFTTWQSGNSYMRESELVEHELMTYDSQGRPQIDFRWVRAFVHKALNALLQGSAADIMKTAMVMIEESGALDVLGAPHLTVHDELDGSLEPTPQAMEALREIQHIMETCVKLSIPLMADLAIADNWGKTKS